MPLGSWTGGHQAGEDKVWAELEKKMSLPCHELRALLYKDIHANTKLVQGRLGRSRALNKL